VRLYLNLSKLVESGDLNSERLLTIERLEKKLESWCYLLFYKDVSLENELFKLDKFNLTSLPLFRVGDNVRFEKD